MSREVERIVRMNDMAPYAWPPMTMQAPPMKPKATLTPGPSFEHVPDGWKAAYDAGYITGFHFGERVGLPSPPWWLEGLEQVAWLNGLRQGEHDKADA